MNIIFKARGDTWDGRLRWDYKDYSIVRKEVRRRLFFFPVYEYLTYSGQMWLSSFDTFDDALWSQTNLIEFWNNK